jgi:hypothetical protein
MPRKIRQLVSDLEAGSHRKFRRLRFSGSVILSGGDQETRIITKRSKSATPFAN